MSLGAVVAWAFIGWGCVSVLSAVAWASLMRQRRREEQERWRIAVEAYLEAQRDLSDDERVAAVMAEWGAR